MSLGLVLLLNESLFVPRRDMRKRKKWSSKEDGCVEDTGKEGMTLGNRHTREAPVIIPFARKSRLSVGPMSLC